MLISEPLYLSGRSADVVLSEIRPTKLAPDALRSVNVLLDELLWMILSTSRSFATEQLKIGFTKLLPNPLGKEALLEAEVELKAYWDRTRDAPSRPYVDNIQDFPLHPAFEVRSLSNLSRFLHFSAPLAHILALFSSPQFIFVICPYSNRSLPPYLLPARVSKLDSLHNSC